MLPVPPMNKIFMAHQYLNSLFLASAWRLRDI
jgi:hypothetical protein